MKLRLCILSAVLAAALSGAAWSYPTRFGPATGLVDMPTADVEQEQGAELAIDFTKVEAVKAYPARLLVGAANGAELGIGYALISNSDNHAVVSYAAKMALMKQPQAAFGLAAGVSFLNGGGEDILNVYAVGSKDLTAIGRPSVTSEAPPLRMRGHLGLMYSRFSNASTDDEVKPFVGFDVETPNGMSFVAEYKWTKFGEDNAAAAVRYPLSPALKLQVGVARTGTILNQNDVRLFIGINYNFFTGTQEMVAY